MMIAWSFVRCGLAILTLNEDSDVEIFLEKEAREIYNRRPSKRDWMGYDY